MQTIKSLQNMKQFFIKNGNKSTMESQLFTFVKERGVSQKAPVETLITKCLHNATSYVYLKMRKRGKRVKYKISYLEEARGNNRACLNFIKLYKDNAKKGENFTRIFEKQLINLSSDKNSLITKRDDMHKIALENIPYTWYTDIEKDDIIISE